MNQLQKAIHWLFQKAVGFPIWQGSSVDSPPGGWRTLDALGGYSALLDVPAFRGCLRVLKHVVSSESFEVFSEDPDGGVTKLFDHPAYPLLFQSPNRHMNSTEMRQAMMEDYCLYGNGYALVDKNGHGRPIAITPLRADRMTPLLLPPNYLSLVYRYSQPNGQLIDYQPEQIVHIKNTTSGGLLGRPHIPVPLLQRALDTHAYGAHFMRNMGRPSGVLSSDQSPPASSEASAAMRAEWDKVFANPQNAGKTAVLWKNLKYQAITANPEEAQFNETIKQLNSEFAAILGVPLNLIDQTDKSATYASAEQFELSFVKHTVRPLAEMMEQAFNQKLFQQKLTASAQRVFCRIDLNELLRGDTKAQADWFATVVRNGGITSDEWRKGQGLPPKGGMADELRCEINMAPLDSLQAIAARATSVPPANVSEVIRI